MSVEHDRQPRIQKYIILNHRLQIFGNVMVITENFFIGIKNHLRTVRLGSRLDIMLFENLGLAIMHIFSFAVAERLYFKTFRQGIYGLDSHTVQTYRLFESFRIVLCTGIHLGRGIHQFP